MKKLTVLVLAIVFVFGVGIASVYANEEYDAGYAWAQANDITDTSYQAAGNSESFNEGVRAYAAEQW